ncbi:hypothetical protein F0562_002065 [Nyssa sinensis]|uniref:Cyclic nucleotide-binding domain-containing protein n=1 Tax=Nyssa sinensis TaxID=561372 RepID=A0A5J5C9V9_9ASTE|nr:hypothetical protein F0562_002065 [Nyssa sinensis]
MFTILIQYLQRLSLAYPLSMKIAKATGIVTETAWLGAAYNLMIYLLSIHRYLQSTTVHLEEWRLKRADKEQWMHHRQLPRELRDCVFKYDQYKYAATKGVDEEALLKDLPKDLRRQIKRHLYLNLIRRVPLFDELDDRMLDSICERLKPVLYTDGTFVVRELDPVHEMVFVIRGHLDTCTTNGGQIGFFNSCEIGPGDFCGEELLTWALDLHQNGILPLSTRTVKAISDVEAFALRAEDLEFVAARFHRLHSKELRHKFRFHSHQWRTWAALFIQVAWRRYKKRKELAQLIDKEYGPGSFRSMELDQIDTLVPHLGFDIAQHAASLITSIRSSRFGSDSSLPSTLQKPLEPDFYR